ncbi:OmpA family protein [Enterovibrio nigricans]|uniref:OmpA family protein n=1 Tax=Enterovibrio nigricans DSM 22720 TaxID=1121868 RepID=A0A1T4UUK7_9GAMM|nr:OmpA family protein [Enterovibrio nigricans]PKF49771.1 OmpA family protein [Enterovibrio nigricans]SKA56308.1 OmpA family protein [Enterovibrio nigricans DSM 22720]
MKQLLTLILPIVVLSGCSMFPDHGQGGMAEHHYASLPPVLPDQPLGPEHGLRFEWELAARHLDILVLEGAELCFPASVVQARKMQDRIVREFIGGLEFDAANDIIIQREALERLEKQLDAVIDSRACVIPGQNENATRELIAKIYGLLNADNQFAFNSPEVNPKYMGHLAEASHLLRDLPEYHLKITGHADSIGNSAANKTLSLARANQVKRYLQIFGIVPARISVAAVGSSDPLFEGNAPEVRLVNRRVSVELVEVAGSKQTEMLLGGR